MKALRAYNVEFAGLKPGLHDFTFEIGETFFDPFGDQDFRKPHAEFRMQLDKRNNLMEVNISMNGKAEVDCDVSGEPFEMDLSSDLTLVVKFGEEFNDEDPEVLILPHDEHQFNVAQYLYEMFVLSLPAKRVHPKLGKEGVGETAIELLERYAPGHDEPETEEESSTDPRWDKLKDLFKDPD